MDYIGITLNTQFLTGDRHWNESLGIEEFDPEETFGPLFQWFVGLGARLDPAAAVAMHFCAPTKYFEFEEFRAGWAAAVADTGITLGYHIPFAHAQLPGRDQFLPTFLEAVGPDHQKLQYAELVIHPPIRGDDLEAVFLRELTAPAFVQALKGCQVNVAIENTQDPGFLYQDPAALVRFRKKLAEEYEALGCADMVQRIRFCLDMGHLLLWLRRDGASPEHIAEWLPRLAAHTSVYHIHANDGTMDQHLVPFCATPNHLPHKKVDEAAFAENSEVVFRWLVKCLQMPGPTDRHLHLELDTPFTLGDVERFYARLFQALQ
jgi:hypothetical protein